MANREPQDIALAVVCRDGLWLVDRRREGPALGGLWEFPGGKMHPGETAREAAVRECAEEVSITVGPAAELRVVKYDYGSFSVRLHPVLCRYVAGTPAVADPAVVEVRWVDDATLASLEMPAANRSIVEVLLGDKDARVPGRGETGRSGGPDTDARAGRDDAVNGGGDRRQGQS